MQQINMKTTGTPDVLFIEETEIPQPQAGEILVKVAYAGVNRPDIMQRQGLYPMPKGVTPIMGLELSGTVAAIGEGVTAFKPGDEICALTDGGAYAEYCIVPATQALPIPKGYSLLEAAALSETFATVGNEEKAAVIRQLGGTPINYKTENFAEVLKQQGGVDAVLDLVGASYFQDNIDSLRQNGRLFLIGFMGGNIAENVDLLTIALKRIHITGSTMRSRTKLEKAEITQSLRNELWEKLGNGEVGKPIIHQVFDFKDVAKAHIEMDKGTHIGKVMLDFTLLNQ